MSKRPTYVFVVNNTGAEFRDRFDGQEYVLPATSKESPICTEIPVEAAQLWFGMGEANAQRAIQRLGLAVTNEQMGQALETLRKFSFHLEAPKGHSTAPVEADSAAEAGEPVSVAVSLEPAGMERVTHTPTRNLLQKLAPSAPAGR